MKALTLLDVWTKVVGWKASYDWAVDNKLPGDQKLSDPDATDYANLATTSTQPFGGALTMADMYHSPKLQFFVMFTQALNQVWNMITYDMPHARAGTNNRFANYAWTLMTMATVGGLIFLIRNKRLPDDAYEWIMALTSQGVDSIPILGGGISAALAKEWYAGRGVNPWPIAVTATQTVLTLTDSQASAARKSRAIVRTATDVLAVTGFPAVMANRTLKAFVDLDTWKFDFDPWVFVGGPPED